MRATKGGGEHERYLAPEARAALESWCQAAGIKQGPIFRRIENQGRVGEWQITSAEDGASPVNCIATLRS